MNTLTVIVISAACAAVGFLSAWFISHRIGEKSVTKATSEAARIVAEAGKESEIIKKEAALEAREQSLKIKSEFDREMEQRKTTLEQAEKIIRGTARSMGVEIEG